MDSNINNKHSFTADGGGDYANQRIKCSCLSRWRIYNEKTVNNNELVYFLIMEYCSVPVIKYYASLLATNNTKMLFTHEIIFPPPLCSCSLCGKLPYFAVYTMF